MRRTVKLHDGLTVGEGGKAMEAEIRSEIFEDEIIGLESGLSGLLLHYAILMRRIVRIGTLQNPTPDVIRKMSRTDAELINKAVTAMDAELAVQSGLIAPAGGNAGGRDEPGGAAPGAPEDAA